MQEPDEPQEHTERKLIPLSVALEQNIPTGEEEAPF
jgi:hypothetical protein